MRPGGVRARRRVAARPDRHRRVAVVGRAGTTIIDDLAELDEFDHPPWTSERVSGTVALEALQSSSGRRAVLSDRSAFPLFVSAVAGVEPLVSTTLQQVARAVDEEQAERLADTVRRIFSRVLRELADLDNPMRTPLGGTEGDRALLLVKDGEAPLLGYLATLVAKEYVLYTNPHARRGRRGDGPHARARPPSHGPPTLISQRLQGSSPESARSFSSSSISSSSLTHMMKSSRSARLSGSRSTAWLVDVLANMMEGPPGGSCIDRVCSRIVGFDIPHRPGCRARKQP